MPLLLAPPPLLLALPPLLLALPPLLLALPPLLLALPPLLLALPPLLLALLALPPLLLALPPLLLALPPLLLALPPLLLALPPLLSAPPLLVLRCCCWCCAVALPRGSPLAGNALTAQRKPTAARDRLDRRASAPAQGWSECRVWAACGSSCRTRVPDRMLGCHRALTSARTRLAVANDGGGSGTGEDDTVGRVADQPEGSFEPVANPGRSNAGVPGRA